MEAFLSFGFLTPSLLLGIPLATAVLMYAYRKRGMGRRQVVASVMILRRLKTTLAARQKFVPPPRFFWELFLLALLGLAAAGLYQRGPRERVAIVLDNSLSMSASTGDRPRFEAAIEDIRGFLEAIGGGARVGLFITTPALTQIGQRLLSPEEAQREVEAVQIAYGADSLQSALTKVVQDTQFDRVVAWSDKKLASPNSRVEVRAPEVARGSNIALREISVQSRPERGVIVIAEVAAFTTGEAAVAVHLTGYKEVAGAVSGVKLAEKQVAVPAGGSARVEFPQESEIFSAYGVRIEGSSRVGEESLDVVPGDNLGFVTTSTGGNLVTVVSADAQAAGSLRALPAVTLKFLSPEQYRASPPTDGIALFHRTVPESLPPTNSLFILPPPGSQLAGTVVQNGPVAITRWEEEHPVLRYLNLPLLRLKALVPLQRPAWAEEIIASSSGTAAFAGEYAGHRYVALGFDLLPFGGRQDPLSSVLLLNAIKWLSGAALSAGYETVPYRIPTVQRLGAKEPQEARYVASAAPQGIKEEGGERIAPVPGLLALGNEGQRTIRAVNFFSDDESNSTTPTSVDIPEYPAPANTTEAGKKSWVDLLVWLVLGLLTVEILLGATSTRSNRAARGSV
jgi:hypothetical protein